MGVDPRAERAGDVMEVAAGRVHMHTVHSADSLNDPEAVVRSARRRGVDRVCITDHNRIAAARALKARFPEHVIVGEEVKTAEGVDVIGLYVSDLIPEGTPARETCERIHAQGGLVYVPHPYAPGKGGNGRILAVIEELVDAVEGFNGRLHRQSLNRRAVAWARERDLPLGAGSDAHALFEVGRSYVEVPAFVDSAAGFLEALRHGTLHGFQSSRAVHLLSAWARLRKLMTRS
jgi:predicted metal-dependent phosphoesterase TrpH